MVIEHAVLFEIPLVDAGRHNGRVGGFHNVGFPFFKRHSYSDAPQLTVGFFSDGEDIAAEVYDGGCDSLLSQIICRAVGNIALCDCPEVDAHSVGEGDGCT